MNAYEFAAEMLRTAEERLVAAKAEAKRLVDEAEAEVNERQAELAQFESAPGIPLPEYR